MNFSDIMFEELGYKLYLPGFGKDIVYKKDDDNLIKFFIEDREIKKDGEYCETCYGVTIPELKAINEKCKELGWFDV